MLKVWIYIGSFIASGGIFFIRNDEPFGFNGSYLAVFGTLFLFFIFLVHFIKKLTIPEISLYSKLFLIWVFYTITAILISGTIFNEFLASFFLVKEMCFVLLLFLSGYLNIRYLKVSFISIILLSSIWVLLSSYLMIDAFLLKSVFRRLKVLSSVNYMAASYASFFLFSGFLLVFKKNQSILRVYLIITIVLSAIGIILSASRSSIFSIIFVLLFVFSTLFSTKSIIIKYMRNKIFLMSTITSMIIFSLFLTNLLQSHIEVDFYRLNQRFSMDKIESDLLRRFDRYAVSLPNSTLELIIGRPNNYALFGGGIHPHNFFISTLAFGGFGSLILFLSFCWTLILKFYQFWKFKSGEIFSMYAIFGMLLPLFLYTMGSGHFTRCWHLFWLLGLICGHFDNIKFHCSQKKIYNRPQIQTAQVHYSPKSVI